MKRNTAELIMVSLMINVNMQLLQQIGTQSTNVTHKMRMSPVFSPLIWRTLPIKLFWKMEWYYEIDVITMLCSYFQFCSNCHCLVCNIFYNGTQTYFESKYIYIQEKFEDTKWIIRSRKSMDKTIQWRPRKKGQKDNDQQNTI
jgi:hypothetical protein